MLTRPAVKSLHTEELVNFHVGLAAVTSVNICLELGAYQVVAAHAASTPEREVAGLLLGQARERNHCLEVIITQALRGQATQGTPVSVQLSFESWKYFIEAKAARYPHLATVGWYHTHPGLGTFLSPTDELAHMSFFGKPWQVALVVDPLQGHWTFFHHQAGKLKRCKKFLLVVPDRVKFDDTAGQLRTHGQTS